MARTVTLRFLGDTTSLDQAFRKLHAESAAASSSVAQSWKSVGSSVTSVGKSITKNLSGPAALAGGYAAKLALDFDSSMLKIRSLVGASAEQVQAWRGDVLDMSRALPQSADELARALYFITSSGIPASDAMEVLNSTARAAAAGLGETEMLADLATSAINAYGPANLNAAQTMDILIAAIREGKAEPEEFAGALGRVIAPAEMLGVSFDQVTGAMSSMSLVGINANEAATGLRATILAMAKPSAGAKKAVAELGLSFDDIRKSVREKGLLATLTDLRDRIGEDDEALGEIFPNVRAFNSVLSVTGENLDNTNRIMEATAGATGGVNEAFDIAATGAKFKLDAALSSLQATMIEIGANIVPRMVTKMERLASIFDWFGNQPPWAKELAANMLLIVAAVGPVLVVVGKLVTAVGAIIGAVGPVLGALAKFWAVLGRIVAVAKTVFLWLRIIGLFLAATFGAPITIAVAAITALVMAFTLAWKHSETFRNIVKGAMDAVGAVMESVGAFFVAAGKIIAKAMSSVGSVIADVGSEIMSVLQTVWDTISPILTAIWETFKTVFDAIAKVVKVALKAIFYAIAVPLAAIGILVVEALNLLLKVWTEVLEAILTVVTAVLGAVLKFWTTVLGKVRDVAVKVWDAITSVVTKALDAIGDVISDVLGAVQKAWTVAWAVIRTALVTAWNAIRAAVTEGIGAVRSVVTSGLNAVKSIFTSVWNALPSPVRSAIESVKSLVSSGISAVFDTIVGLGRRITSVAGSLFDGLKNGFRDAVNWIIGKWNGLSLNVPKVEVAGVTVFGGGSIGTPDIPMLANGAIVDSPTLAMIGEAGREVVLPLSRPDRAAQLLEQSGLMSRLSSGSRSRASTSEPERVTIEHLNIHTVTASPEETAYEIAWALNTRGL